MAYVPKSPEIAFARSVVTTYIPSESLEKIDFDAHLVYAEAVLERPEGARQMPAGSLEAFLALWKVSSESALAYVKDMPVENTTGTGIEDVVRTLRDFGKFFRDPRPTKSPLDRALLEIFGNAKVEPAVWGDVLDTSNISHSVYFFHGYNSFNTSNGGNLEYGDGPVLVTKLQARVTGKVAPDFIRRAALSIHTGFRNYRQQYPLEVVLHGVDLLMHVPPNDRVELEGRFGSGWEREAGLTITLEGWRKAKLW